MLHLNRPRPDRGAEPGTGQNGRLHRAENTADRQGRYAPDGGAGTGVAITTFSAEAVMLSKMPLALAHGQPAPPFNADFYSVAATVIPVLFLAVAVQGHAYQDLLSSATDAGRRFRET